MRDAPDLQVESWLNTDAPMRLADLRGRVVVVHVFQMLCPACVRHSIPQANRLFARFAEADDVVVLGLHSVFEHHTAMAPDSLRAFVAENALKFPIAIDQPRKESSIPATMAAYDMQGTPTVLLIDRSGKLRLHHFGLLDDLQLGLSIGYLRAEGVPDGSASP